MGPHATDSGRRGRDGEKESDRTGRGSSSCCSVREPRVACCGHPCISCGLANGKPPATRPEPAGINPKSLGMGKGRCGSTGEGEGVHLGERRSPRDRPVGRGSSTLHLLVNPCPVASNNDVSIAWRSHLPPKRPTRTYRLHARSG